MAWLHYIREYYEFFVALDNTGNDFDETNILDDDAM